MALAKNPGCQKLSVSASELAQMGVCERLVVFEHRYGMRRTVEQQRAVARGRLAHVQFYRARCRDSDRRGGGAVAALVFGARGLGKNLARQCQYWVRRLRQVWYRLTRFGAPRCQSSESRNEP